MKYLILAFILVAQLAFAGKPVKPTETIPLGWNEATFGGYAWVQNGPQINFHPYVIGGRDNYSTAFYVTNYVASLNTNSTFTLQVTVTGNNIGWMYGGQFSFNTGAGRPANVRLYFSSSDQKYSNTGPEDAYWFCNAPESFAWMPTGTSTINLTGRLDPSQWTNGQGHYGNDRIAGFLLAIQNVKVAGGAFGGNRFFDTGVAYTNGGPATLTLNNFYVQ